MLCVACFALRALRRVCVVCVVRARLYADFTRVPDPSEFSGLTVFRADHNSALGGGGGSDDAAVAVVRDLRDSVPTDHFTDHMHEQVSVLLPPAATPLRQ